VEDKFPKLYVIFVPEKLEGNNKYIKKREIRVQKVIGTKCKKEKLVTMTLTTNYCSRSSAGNIKYNCPQLFSIHFWNKE